ncbi:hypothetical protein pb186bvf_004763 [Paramecium bursaria]
MNLYQRKSHYDPFYTRIYGIVNDVQYLKNADDNFEIAYKSLIEYLEKNDRLTKWYEKEIKEFHQQYGIPAILNQRLTRKVVIKGFPDKNRETIGSRYKFHQSVEFDQQFEYYGALRYDSFTRSQINSSRISQRISSC